MKLVKHKCVSWGGVPYIYGANLQDQMVMCCSCNEVFEKKDLHTDCNGVTPEFRMVNDQFILLPGPGHLEINMGRIALSLMWDPILKTISSLLGFRTLMLNWCLRLVLTTIEHNKFSQLYSNPFRRSWWCHTCGFVWRMSPGHQVQVTESGLRQPKWLITLTCSIITVHSPTF